MKIALSFYGQIRYLTPAYIAWKKNIIDPLNIKDIYMHTWIGQDNINEFKDLFKPTKLMLSDNDDIKKTSQWVETPLRKRSCVRNTYNTQSLFFSIYNAANIIENKYDIIILSRLDHIFYNEINSIKVGNNEILSSTGMFNPFIDNRWRSICDWFAIGDYDSIQKFASVGINYKDIYNSGVQFHPETLVGENSKREGLLVKPVFKVDIDHCLATNVRELADKSTNIINDVPDDLRREFINLKK